MDDMHDDRIMMQDGKVLISRKGELMLLDEDMTMPDGTKVMMDGTMMMPDGTTRMMQEGESMRLQSEPASPEDMTDRQFEENMEDEELRDELH